ncbi:MAG: methyltransferase domain-containing protein [Cyclobacteriaceae bacterium]
MLKRILSIMGFTGKSKVRNNAQLYSLNTKSYLNTDGSFNYSHYRKVQEEGNKRKLKNVWVLEENISFLSDYLINKLGIVKFGICHGTRQGLEQKWFRKYLNCEVIGTEISETATQFPDTIQWDFHETKKEWLDAVDFIYSNSFDHSYNPESCLNNWMSCVKPGGLCILEHSDRHGISSSTDLDPFGADLVVMPYLITLWGGGKYFVRAILEAPARRNDTNHIHFLVIEKASH